MPDTEPSSATDQKSAPRPFDIRRVIGGLFVLYGVVVMIAGIVDGDAAKKKAAGIDINLWTGLGMLLLGVFFLVWMRLNPLPPAPPADAAAAAGDDRPAH
jgi:xanthine/uracil/vitamin C permease (AzgA family)